MELRHYTVKMENGVVIDLDTKKIIQNLVFPEGIFWDKKKRNYRTNKRNAVF